MVRGDGHGSPCLLASSGRSFWSGPGGLRADGLTAVDRDRLLADTRAFAESESAPGVTIEAVVREGSTAAEILEQAEHEGRSARHRHARAIRVRSPFLGSVAEKVLRKASCPVLTVPKRLPDAVPAGPVLYKRILCPVDFSDSSLHALKYAISMAQEADGQLTVLHVVAHEFENDADMATWSPTRA